MMPLARGDIPYESKNGIACVISHNYARNKINAYDSLPLEKTLTLRNVIILIKSVFNKV